MPRGIPNVKAAPAVTAAPVVNEEPAPMIFIEPAADGSIRLNAYGLYAGEVVDALRRALIHLRAQRAGVQVISPEVPPRATVRLTPAPEKFAKPGKPGRNGSKPVDRSVPTYSLADLGLDEEES